MVPMEQTGTGSESTVPLRLRRAGRVIVLDPDDRVLLFRYDDELPNGRHWCTPGGGLNDGEDYPAGARREQRGGLPGRRAGAVAGCVAGETSPVPSFTPLPPA